MDKLSLLWQCLLCNFAFTWALEPVTTVAVTVAAISALWGVIDQTPCRLMECCDRYSIATDAKNITALQKVLQTSVYGQHIMEDIVVRALRGHYLSPDPGKALVLSFHGPPGSGKSFVSEFIAQSLYSRGMKSKYVRKFVGGIDFPDHRKKEIYKVAIIDEIRRIRGLCERPLYIFEDVKKMPEGVLDSLAPFIDHHSTVLGQDFRKSIFILLSNTGAKEIVKKTLDLWSKGTQREDIIKLKDFEPIIRQGAFNEEGGWHRSHAISSSLIDHYIPFLPLEEKHLIKCIEDAFKKFGYTYPLGGAVEKILEDMTFIPPQIELFSATGCKRVDSKVTAYVYGEKFTSLFN